MRVICVLIYLLVYKDNHIKLYAFHGHCRYNLQRGNTAIFFLTLGITLECLWVHRILYYFLNMYIVFWIDDNGIWNNYVDSWFVLVTSIGRGNIKLKICKNWNFHSQYNDIAVSYFFLNFTISSLILVNKSSQIMAIYKYE